MTSIRHALLPGGRLYRWFVVSAAFILLFTALVKLASFIEGGPLIERKDPVFNIKLSFFFFFSATVEIIAAAMIFGCGRNVRSCLIVLWVSSLFIIYRLTLYLIGWGGFCQCLGNFSEWSGLSNQQLNALASAMAWYLFLGSLVLIAVNELSSTRIQKLLMKPSATRVVLIVLAIFLGLPQASRGQEEVASVLFSGVVKQHILNADGKIRSGETNFFQVRFGSNSWRITLVPNKLPGLTNEYLFDGEKLTAIRSHTTATLFRSGKLVTNLIQDSVEVFPGQWPIFNSAKNIAIWALACTRGYYSVTNAEGLFVPPRATIPAMLEKTAFRQRIHVKYSDAIPWLLESLDCVVSDQICNVSMKNEIECSDRLVRLVGHYTNVTFKAKTQLIDGLPRILDGAEYTVYRVTEDGDRGSVVPMLRCVLTDLNFKVNAEDGNNLIGKLPGGKFLVTEWRNNLIQESELRPRYLSSNSILLPLAARQRTGVLERRDGCV